MSIDYLQMTMVTKMKSITVPKPLGSVEDFTEAVECLKTLAHPARLRIVIILLHGRSRVGELATDCGIQDNVGLRFN